MRPTSKLERALDMVARLSVLAASLPLLVRSLRLLFGGAQTAAGTRALPRAARRVLALSALSTALAATEAASPGGGAGTRPGAILLMARLALAVLAVAPRLLDEALHPDTAAKASRPRHGSVAAVQGGARCEQRSVFAAKNQVSYDNDDMARGVLPESEASPGWMPKVADHPGSFIPEHGRPSSDASAEDSPGKAVVNAVAALSDEMADSITAEPEPTPVVRAESTMPGYIFGAATPPSSAPPKSVVQALLSASSRLEKSHAGSKPAPRPQLSKCDLSDAEDDVPIETCLAESAKVEAKPVEYGDECGAGPDVNTRYAEGPDPSVYVESFESTSTASSRSPTSPVTPVTQRAAKTTSPSTTPVTPIASATPTIASPMPIATTQALPRQ
jgi:hypothetical protein